MKLSGIDVEIPKELNKPDADPEQVLSFVQEKLTEKAALSDPFISEYLQASKQEGFSREKFLESYGEKFAMLNLPNKDFLMKVYEAKNGKSEENPNGWTKEDIETYLNKMSRIEIDEKAEAMKNSYRDSISKPTVDKEAFTKRVNTANTAITDRVKKLSAIMSKEEDIGGIPHTKEDNEKFTEFFTAVSKVNPETGKTAIQAMLNDDKILYKAMYLLWKAEGTEENIKSWISDFKESYKADVLNKAGVNQRRSGGNTRQVSVMKADDFV